MKLITLKDLTNETEENLCILCDDDAKKLENGCFDLQQLLLKTHIINKFEDIDVPQVNPNPEFGITFILTTTNTDRRFNVKVQDINEMKL